MTKKEERRQSILEKIKIKQKIQRMNEKS